MKTWQRRTLVVVLYTLLFLVSVVAFLYLGFPWERAARYAEAAAAKKLDMDVHIGGLAPSWLTGIELTDVTLRTRKPDRQGHLRTFHADRVVVRASLGTLFGGDVDVDFTAAMMGGNIDGQVYRTNRDTRIVAHLSDVSPNDITVVRDMVGLPIKGRMGGQLDLTLREHRFTRAAGSIEFTARNVIVGDGKARLKLKVKPQFAELQEFLDREDQGVAIPPMKVGLFTIKMRVSHGSARITQFGASSEHIEIKGEGELTLAEPVTASKSAIYIQYRLTEAYQNLDSEARSLMDNMRGSPVYRRALRSDGFYGFCLSGVLRERIRPLPARDGCPDNPPAEPAPVPTLPTTPMGPTPVSPPGPTPVPPPAPTILGAPAPAVSSRPWPRPLALA